MSKQKERLKKIDDFFDHVSTHLSFSKINPKNSDQVRSRFLKRMYTPVFEYDPLPHLNILKGILEVMQINGESQIEKIFEKKRKELLLKLALLQSRGTEDFAKYSAKIYPPPNKQLIETAKNILTLPKSPKDERIPRKDAVKHIRAGIKLLGLDWKVRNKNLVASAEVNPQNKTVYLRKGERFAKNFTKRLVIHEIGTHVVRAENASLQQYKLFRNGFPSYLETEEGLAAYNEYSHNLMTTSVLKNYAGRVLAIHYALNHDFKQTYKYMRTYFGKKTALKLTLRAKRGLPDGKTKGAYTKDAVYLRGFLKVAKYAKRQKGDLNKLYIGKIGLTDLKQLEKIKHKAPKFFPPKSFEEPNQNIKKLLKL